MLGGNEFTLDQHDVDEVNLFMLDIQAAQVESKCHHWCTEISTCIHAQGPLGQSAPHAERGCILTSGAVPLLVDGRSNSAGTAIKLGIWLG